MRRLAPLLLLALLLAPAASAAPARVVQARGVAASIAPASAPILVAVNTDKSSQQWRTMDALRARFPAADEYLDSIAADVLGEGSSFTRDLQPLLGPELDLVWLDLDNDGEDVVVAAQTTNPAPLVAVLQRQTDAVVKQDGALVLFAPNAELIDRFEAARAREGSLLDSPGYKQALSHLPGEALVRFYADGAALQKAEDAAGSAGDQFGTLHWVGGVFQARPVGLWFDVQASQEGSPLADEAPYEPQLPAAFPLYTWAYLSYHGLDREVKPQIDKAWASSRSTRRILQGFQRDSGLSIKHDIYPVISGELGLGLVPHGESVTPLLAFSETDDAKAQKVVEGVGRFLARSGLHVAHPTVAGHRVIQIVIRSKTRSHTGQSIYAGAFDGKLVVSPSREAIAGPPAGESLATQSELGSMRKNAGMAKVTSFEFVNVRRLVALFLSADDQEAIDLKPLHALLVFTTREEERLRVAGLLTID